MLWESDPERSRELFRRAWDSADAADSEAARQRAEDIKRMQASGEPIVLRGGLQLRNEVLRIVAKRDPKLTEEFLKIFDDAKAKENEEATAPSRRNVFDQTGPARRLQLARQLVQEGDVDRGWAYAVPALDRVNIDTITFLSTLREKNASLADKAFEGLLARAARDPLSDANTVSGLSSYAFTPFLYIEFEGNGANQSQSRRNTQPPADLSPRLRGDFLKVAFEILMRPLPAPDQDRTAGMHRANYMVIKRLLPIFEQYAPDLAPGLRPVR